MRHDVTNIDSSNLLSLAILSVAFAVCAALWHRSHRGAAWAIWASAILMATIPIFDLHAHTHWVNVTYNPFVLSPKAMVDIAANVLLYMPLGVRARPRQPVRRRVTRVAGAALVLTLVAEGSQLFSHSRVPSPVDMVANILGAVLGACVAARAHSSM